MIEKGKVYLVGAGPGATNLQTQRCMELIKEADVIVYDSLVSPGIIKYSKIESSCIYVGKRVGKHSYKQEDINKILVEKARLQLSVVRLKGGDPFVFGRGGEEMEFLHKNNIPYEIIPGITSGIAAAAYFGIPITNRGLSTSVTFITGQTKDCDIPNIDWKSLVAVDGTIVFYMGTGATLVISKKLIEAGMSPNTPMAVISNGTMANQSILSRNLKDFSEDFTDYTKLSPGLIVVGNVVNFAEIHKWYKPKPLSGKNILITRSLNQSSKLSTILEEEGAEVFMLPTIRIVARTLSYEIKECIKNIKDYSWIFFTSPNAVRIFINLLIESNKDIRDLYGLKIGVVGKTTAKELLSKGILYDFIPSEYTAEALAKEWIEHTKTSNTDKVLIPGSAISSPSIANHLSAAKIVHNILPIYDNVAEDYNIDRMKWLKSLTFDWITFCSSSAVDNFMNLVNKYDLSETLNKSKIAAIGNITAKTIKSYGLNVDVIPEIADMKSLSNAIIRF